MECPVCGEEMELLPYKSVTLGLKYWRCPECGTRKEDDDDA